MSSNFKNVLMIIILISFLSACIKMEEVSMDENQFIAKENTQITFEELKLGFGVISRDQYVDQSGESKFGNTVRIWPFLKNEEKGRQSILAYEGFITKIGDYTVEILDLKRNIVTLSIKGK